MRIDKYSRSQVGGLLKHIERSLPKVKENIDTSKTKYNFSTVEKGDSYKYYKSVLDRDDVYVMKRDNVKTLCSLVLTLPRDENNKLVLKRYGDIKEFFEHATDFFIDRYGVENGMNLVNATVHMDETTPHMHLTFIPLTSATEKQKSKGYKYRCSARDVINKKELQTLHDDMSKYMKQCYGRNMYIRNGNTSTGNVDMKKLRETKEVTSEYNLLVYVFSKVLSVLPDKTKETIYDYLKIEYDKHPITSNQIKNSRKAILGQCKPKYKKEISR